MTFFDGYVKGVEWTTVVIAVIILISSMDDLVIDIWFWGRAIYRGLFVKTRFKALQPEDLDYRPEQALALAIPAWREADVIGPMIDNLINGLDYQNYRIFIGTYPNDAATIDEVERLRRRYRRLVRVELPLEGPTCKADCLNAVVHAILETERAEGQQLAGVVLHDCEDVVHPLELKFFNYLLPRKDMVQIPVLPIERHWTNLVGNTYADEFAEAHGKDLVVRESLTGAVPSAGVGTCFSRRAIVELVAARDGRPFNTASLTEDYDIAARLNQAGMSSIIARFTVDTDLRRPPWFRGPGRAVRARLPLAVREFFPDTFDQASRQRARWNIGIGMQSWKQLGWQGSFADRYFLLRDRKGVVTSLVAALAYLFGLQVSLLFLLQLWGRIGPLDLFHDEPFMGRVFALNGILLVVRAVQRAYFVGRFYGPAQALLSSPRLVVSNFVNFVAAVRAWRTFIGHGISGEPIAWDKTDHEFPSIERGEDRRRLGELLLAWGAVNRVDLDAALAENQSTRRPLGGILVAHGWLDEETLAEAIAYQGGLERGRISAEIVGRNRAALPAEACVRARTVALDPVGETRVLAVAAPLSPTAMQALSSLGVTGFVQRVVRDSEIAEALRLIRGAGAAGSAATPLLGDIMAARAGVDRQALENAMAEYQISDGRVGEYLMRRGVITAEALAWAVDEQRRLAVVGDEVR